MYNSDAIFQEIADSPRIRYYWFRAVMCLVAGCLFATSERAEALTTLFSDNFTGQSGLPTYWMFGSAYTSGTVVAGDTFAVVNNGTSDVLRTISATPITTVPVYHTATGVNFLATGDKVLQLNLDLTINNNAADYRFGLYNAVGGSGGPWMEAYEFRMYPSLTTNNVSIYSLDNSGAGQDVVTFTVSQSLLQGTHSFALQLDFTASVTAPVIRVYSNGTLLKEMTANPAGGFHPSGTDAQVVRIMSQATYLNYSGTSPSYDLDNVTLTSFTAGSILLGNIKNSTSVNPLIFGGNIEAADPSYIDSDAPASNPCDSLTTGGGIWDPSAKTVPSAVLGRATGDTSLKALRYPGGCLAHNYNWKGTVGSIGSRARSDWKFGMDEYLSACAQIGATPIITCSDYCLAASDMPQNLADLVDYLNAPAIASHPWAMQRAANGHSAPYGVKYFEMGNESMHGNHYVTPFREYTSSDYNSYATSSMWAMRAVDPTIYAGVVLLPGGGQDVGFQWNIDIMQGSGKAADFAILHMYAPGDYDGDPAPASEAHLMEACMAVGDQIEQHLQDYHSMIADSCGHDLPLAVTEYNSSFTRSTGPAYRFSLAEALECADMVRIFLKPANGVLTAGYWQWNNGYWGMLQFTDRPATTSTTFTEESAYPCFRLWGKHFGSTLTSASVSSPTSAFSGANSVDLAEGTIYEPETLLSGPTALLSGIPLSNFNNISGLSASKTSDTLVVTLNNYTGNNYPWIAGATPPGSANGNPVNYRLSFEGSVAITSGSCNGFYLYEQDSRGWTLTHSNQSVGPIVSSTLQAFEGELHSLVDCPGASTLVPLEVGTATVSGVLNIKNPQLSIYSQPIYPSYNLLTAAASTSTDGHTVYLMVFNKSILHIPTTINLNGFTSTSAKQWQVNGPNLAATTGVSEVVSGATFALNGGGGSANYVFPAHSMTAIEFTR